MSKQAQGRKDRGSLFWAIGMGAPGSLGTHGQPLRLLECHWFTGVVVLGLKMTHLLSQSTNFVLYCCCTERSQIIEHTLMNMCFCRILSLLVHRLGRRWAF